MKSQKHAATSGQTPVVFLSYRRADTAGHAGRLRDALDRRLRGGLFRDIDKIGGGQDFVQAIDEAVAQCKVLLVLIGDQWLSIKDAEGRRRLDNPKDFVRREIAEALRRGVTVIPVLVEGATMPGEADLPDDLNSLARRNAMELSETRWEYDVDQLVKALGQHVEVCADGDEAAGGLFSRGKGVTVTRVALALLAVAALAGAGLVGRSLLSGPLTKASEAGAVITATPSAPSAADVKEQELKQALELIGNSMSASDKVLSLTVLATHFVPDTEEEAVDLDKRLMQHIREYEQANTEWTRKGPWLNTQLGGRPSWAGARDAVTAYMNCVSGLNAAVRDGKPLKAFPDRCERQKNMARDAVDKLTADGGEAGR
ncbi:MAG TPA: toll/interleukin-1 receptor domain-containing protein [Pyrinomonadaceae bacterium]|nr:toll/interleukin-1 receptor domain-containing protein [Pyrinomonadaceae bacterium]